MGAVVFTSWKEGCSSPSTSIKGSRLGSGAKQPVINRLSIMDDKKVSFLLSNLITVKLVTVALTFKFGLNNIFDYIEFASCCA